MYVCLCHGVTDKQIRTQVKKGLTRLTDIRDELGVASQCGKCACAAQAVLNEHKRNATPPPAYKAA